MKRLPQNSLIRSGIIALFALVTVGVLALFVAFQFNSSTGNGLPTSLPSADTAEKTTEGKLTCLPHKDTSGPITLECAIGLKTATNEHYALDTAAFASSIFTELSMDQNIAVTGTVTPLAQVLDTSVEKYDIVGVIHVIDVEKKP